MSSRFHKNRDRDPDRDDLLPSERNARRARPTDEEGGSRWAQADGAGAPAPIRGKGCLLGLAMLFFPLTVALGIAIQTGSWEGTDPFVAHIEQGKTLSYAGKLDEAMAEFEAAKALRPTEPLVYDRIAVIHLERKELDRCEAVVREGLAFDPGNPSLHLTYGLVYAQRDDDRAAIVEYKKAIAAAYAFATAHYDLGLAYDRIGERALAIEELEIAARLSPNDDVGRDARAALADLRR